MEDIWLLVAAIVLLVAQVLCIHAKKVWVRLIPTLIAAALTVLCVVMYALSAFTNWAYLILIFLLLVLLAVMGMMWLIRGIVRAIKK